jgi:hypothetical protein
MMILDISNAFPKMQEKRLGTGLCEIEKNNSSVIFYMKKNLYIHIHSFDPLDIENDCPEDYNDENDVDKFS